MKEPLTDEESNVWELISWRGPSNPLPQREIARIVGLRDVREVRLITFSLNQKGYGAATRVRPPYGVHAIKTEKERDEYIAQLHSRGHGCFQRARLVEALELDGHVQQMEMGL